MKKLLVAVMMLWAITGCAQSHTEALNALRRPVSVVSRGENGGVLLSGADGTLYLAKADTYLGQALKDAPIGILGEQPKGYKYSTKLVTCKKCGTETVVIGEECKP